LQVVGEDELAYNSFLEDVQAREIHFDDLKE
jgi:hypothetical protein